MKALILAAGSPGHDRESPWVLQSLGDKYIIDYVVELARRVVEPPEITVVIAQDDDRVAQHLGPDYHYVVQQDPHGTGHAVLAARDHYKGYEGSLLILYGDTPLFRPSSILGLITRHRLKGAALTLLTAITEASLPYGRVVRDRGNRIVAVVEERNANLAVQQITELNIGAYVAEAAPLWPALGQVVSPQLPGECHFTDCVRVLAETDQIVKSYAVLDEDEMLGVNTSADLNQASFILQKRQLRPRRIEERNIVRFGTGGWRAMIGEGFTLDNVRRLCQALANNIVRNGRERDGVVIGYDRRFLGKAAAQAAAEVFAGNNVTTRLQIDDTPTSLVTYATAMKNSAYGLMFTASHNPPEWNGLKVFASDGSLPLDDETKAIEQETNALTIDEVVKVELEIALQTDSVTEVDYTNDYVDAVESLVDLQAIREAGLRVVLDPMYGVGQVTLEFILTAARCRVNTIRGRHDPLFGGLSPAPERHALSQLINTVREGHYDLGLAMDGDADRIAIVDNRGNYVSTNQLLLLLYYYLRKERGERGGVTRNLATTHLLDRLAAHCGESCYEVPVGFKHLAASMKEHDVLLAGESSGGLSIRGHILGKDGIFACALVVEMMARTGRSIADMLAEIEGITGILVSTEVNLPATPEMKVFIPRKLAAADHQEVAGYRVARVSHEDGTKFYLENDNWLLMRFSGTEPLLRIFVEADDQQKAERLLTWARSIVHQ